MIGEVSELLEQAEAVGDAVLYEGYLLYPYRASASKNRFRWQWGVLMPPAFADEEAGEYDHARSACVVEPRSHTTLHVRVRFLHAQARIAQQRGDDGYQDVASLTVDGTEYTTWDEAVRREVDAVIPLSELLAQPVEVPFTIDAAAEPEELTADARLLRRTRMLSGTLRAALDSLDGPYGGARLRVHIRNTSDWSEPGASRDAALHHSLLATHLLLSVDSGHFLSMLDPPEWARPAVESCVNERMWPVLVGDAERSPIMLCSPIILYDDPAVAEESQGSLYDGTEIDEILTLRTMALTDEEKRQARATDPKAAEIIDRVDDLPGELLDRLHGTVRYLREVTGESEAGTGPGERADVTAAPGVPWWDPGSDTSVSPESDSVTVAGVAVAKGSPVILRPGLRRADAQDMFLAGRAATVRAVLFDVDDGTYLAVTLDEDPAADLQDTHGRYRYFSPDEIEPRTDAEVPR